MTATTPDVQTTSPKRKRKFDGWGLAGWVFLVALLIFSVVQMLWMFLTSIKTQFAALQYPPQWFPREPTLENYRNLLSPYSDVGPEFLRYMVNSVWVSTATTLVGVIVAVPAAYAFSRFRFPGRGFLFYSVLLRNMFPAVIFLMPLLVSMVGIVFAIYKQRKTRRK